jgi:ADP-ribosylglycohydrolase/catechol 2,3-dioxygenase-like lactoylglutathione lyase family enzyme
VARSVLHGDNWLDYWTRVELPLWTVYERGGGGATKRAAQAWLRGRAPWDEAEKEKAVEQYFDAGGNGTVMRCLGHCVIAETWVELAQRLDLDAATTHGHPRALLGSRVYGWAAQFGLQRRAGLAYGELLDRVVAAEDEWSTPPNLPGTWHEAAQRATGNYESEWQAGVKELREALEIARSGISEGAVAVDRPILEAIGAFGESSGAGTVSATAAIFLATRYLSQPQQGLMSAAFARGADTDTIAAMTGGLLGLLSGTGWLGSLAARVQDHDYTRELAGQLDIRQQAEDVEWQFTTGERTRLYGWLDEATMGMERELPPFGRLHLTEVDDFTARTQFIRAWTLDTGLGQSLLIKRYNKGQDGHSRWAPISPPVGSSSETSLQPRVGIVLRVTDVERSKAFYTEVVGLAVRRATDQFISFGWLAIEPDERDGQLSFESGAELHTPVIRLYVKVDELEQMGRRFGKFGLGTKPLEDQEHRGFQSRDPDGHPMEVIARSETPTVG